MEDVQNFSLSQGPLANALSDIESNGNSCRVVGYTSPAGHRLALHGDA